MPFFIFPGVLPASCQRCIFTLAMSMLAFTGKVCHITELSDLLRCFTSSNVSSRAENDKIVCPFMRNICAVFLFKVFGVFFYPRCPAICTAMCYLANCHAFAFSFMISEMCLNVLQVDPFLRIGEDLQLYVRLQSDLGSYGSESDQEVAKSTLSECRTKVGISDQRMLDVIASALSSFTEVSPIHEWCDFLYVCCLDVMVSLGWQAVENGAHVLSVLRHGFSILIRIALPDGQGCTSKGTY